MSPRIYMVLALLLAGAAAKTASAAETYRGEVAGLALYISADPDSDTYVLGASGTAYVFPVDITEDPYGEIAFSERAAAVNLLAAYSITEIGDLGGTTADISGDGIIVGVNVRVSNRKWPVDVELGYQFSQSSLDGDAGAGPTVPVDLESDAGEFNFGFGVYPIDNFRVGLGITHSDGTGELDFAGVRFADFDTTQLDIAVGARYLIELPEKVWLAVEGSFTRIDYDEDTTSYFPPGTSSEEAENHEAAVSGDLYLNQQFGLGLGFILNSGQNEEQEGFTIEGGFSYFVNANFGLGLDVGVFSAEEDQGDDSVQVGVTVGGRF